MGKKVCITVRLDVVDFVRCAKTVLDLVPSANSRSKVVKVMFEVMAKKMGGPSLEGLTEEQAERWLEEFLPGYSGIKDVDKLWDALDGSLTPDVEERESIEELAKQAMQQLGHATTLGTNTTGEEDKDEG